MLKNDQGFTPSVSRFQHSLSRLALLKVWILSFKTGKEDTEMVDLRKQTPRLIDHAFPCKT